MTHELHCKNCSLLKGQRKNRYIIVKLYCIQKEGSNPRALKVKWIITYGKKFTFCPGFTMGYPTGSAHNATTQQAL